jgi:ATP-dependent Lon protease
MTDGSTVAFDDIDRIAAQAFEGRIVRKDLVRSLKGRFPVPTYVGEFMLGRYCASTDPEEIQEGIEIVQRQLAERTVRAGDAELLKSRARELGRVKLIDIVSASLDARRDAYVVQLPSLQLKSVRVADEIVRANERMLTGGVYAEVTLSYDGVVAEEKDGRPFGVEALRPIQVADRHSGRHLAQGRRAFTTPQWRDFLLRSVGYEPTALDERARTLLLARMIPFVVRNYNLVELGPRGTGKSHIYQQVSPYSHLVSGGKATVAKMFVNNANGQRGLVCQYDVVCLDEISGISFDAKDGVNIMKGYMESGEFSRGNESIRGEGSIVMVGNFSVDVAHQQRIGHLLSPLPKEMRDDTAFMDRIHAYVPGWDSPKMGSELLTDHFGLVSDFLAEAWADLRREDRWTKVAGRVRFGSALSGRDVAAAAKTVDGLLKLLYPDDEMEIEEEYLDWAVRVGLEGRRRVKEQQKRIGAAEFRNTAFSYAIGEEGVEQHVGTPELVATSTIGIDALPPGQVWALSEGGAEEPMGLFRIECSLTDGSGISVVNTPAPAGFRESVKVAQSLLIANAAALVGDRNPSEHGYRLQLSAHDAGKDGRGLGLAGVIAMASALIGRSVKGGLVVLGDLNLGGATIPVRDIVGLIDHAIEKGARSVLLPSSAMNRMAELDAAQQMKIENWIPFQTPANAFARALED